MANYKDYENYEKMMQTKQSELFDKYGVGFCFGSEQTEEYIRRQTAKGYTGKFVRVSGIGGMICRKDTVNEMLDALSALHKEWNEGKKKAFSMDEYIEVQLSNYEIYYTGNCRDEALVDAIQSTYPEATIADIERVYRNTRDNHEL